MENTTTDKKVMEQIESAHEEANTERAEGKRPRSVTVLKLQVVAERLRKIERIKRELAAGTYCVDSTKVARAMFALDAEEEEESKNKAGNF